MTPEVKRLVEAAWEAAVEIGDIGLFVSRDELLAAIRAVEASESPAACHAAAIARGHEWDNDEIGFR